MPELLIRGAVQGCILCSQTDHTAVNKPVQDLIITQRHFTRYFDSSFSDNEMIFSTMNFQIWRCQSIRTVRNGEIIVGSDPTAHFLADFEEFGA